MELQSKHVAIMKELHKKTAPVDNEILFKYFW